MAKRRFIVTLTTTLINPAPLNGTPVPLTLLIPFSSKALLEDLLREAAIRANRVSQILRLHLPSNEIDGTFEHDQGNCIRSAHLGNEKGPILDWGDVLEDVVEQGNEIWVRYETLKETDDDSTALTPGSSKPVSPVPDHTCITVRLISPEDARSTTSDPPTYLFSNTTTLAELKTSVAEELETGRVYIPAKKGMAINGECNCCLSKKIFKLLAYDTPIQSSQSAHVNISDNDPLNPPTIRLIIVDGNSKITSYPFPAPISSKETPLASIEFTAHELKDLVARLYPDQEDLAKKGIRFWGNHYNPLETEGGPLIRLGGYLIASICDASRVHHQNPVASLFLPFSVKDMESQERQEAEVEPSQVLAEVDIWTTEALISTADLSVTLEELGFNQLSDKFGTVNIYVLARPVPDNKEPPTASSTAWEGGKEGIFSKAPHWNLPKIRFSERALAAFLSALRVFVHALDHKNITMYQQNRLLMLVHRLCSFPPAVKSWYTFINQSTPRKEEAAVVMQTMFWLAKEVVPMELIENDEGRVLEGIRGVFGLLWSEVIAAGKEEKRNISLALGGPQTPYIDSIKILELTDSITKEIVRDPVGLEDGSLVERALYQSANEPGRILYNKRMIPFSKVDCGWSVKARRICLATGCKSSAVAHWDESLLSSLGPSTENYMESKFTVKLETSALSARPWVYQFDEVVAKATGKDNPLRIVAPMGLRTENAPVLSFDGDGLVGVYVGRAACVPSDRDITIFRPTRGGDITVDVSLITQLISPIIEMRKTDGTSLFESFGEPNSGVDGRLPQESIVVCLDISASMRRDFNSSTTQDDKYTYKATRPPRLRGKEKSAELKEAGFDKAKQYLASHESYTDILHIIRRTNSGKKKVILDIIDTVVELYYREIEHSENENNKMESLAGRWGPTWGAVITRDSRYQAQIQRTKALAKQARCLENWREWLEPWLLSEAAKISSDAEQVKPECGGINTTEVVSDSLDIPSAFTCPISMKLFENPVVAEDGITYERDEIKKWFHNRNTSPCTGLPVNTSLSPNRALEAQIKEWIEGDDLVDTIKNEVGHGNWAPNAYAPQFHGMTEQPLLNIRFHTTGSTWCVSLPAWSPTKHLKKLVFRRIKGHSKKFSLLHDHALRLLDVSAGATLMSNHVKTGDSIWVLTTGDEIQVEEASKDQSVLVKIYHRCPRKPDLCYWLPQGTEKTAASILFRYWRWCVISKSKNIHFNLEESGMTLGCVYSGDGIAGGFVQSHWEKLGDIMRRFSVPGILADSDPLYHTDIDATKIEIKKVLKIHIGKYNGKLPTAQVNSMNKNLSRLEVVKQIFETFIDRTLAYNYPNHIGLITFATEAKIAQDITAVMEDFRSSINNVGSKGDTALWDSLALADQKLEAYAVKFPNAKKRIICLSDGVNTSSSKADHEVCATLQRHGVVVDSFSIGDEDNAELKAVSLATGGYKFEPKDLDSAMSICELETVLTQLDRPLVKPLPINIVSPASFQSLVRQVKPDVFTRDVYPARKQHERINDSFIGLSDAARRFKKNAEVRQRGKNSRLMFEIRNVMDNINPYYDVYVSETNMEFWKVLMQGPPESPFANGWFLIYVEMDATYPTFAPKARFITPILHPNVNRHGRICHSILDRNWTTDTSIVQVLNSIWALLLVPDTDDPANIVLTFNHFSDKEAHEKSVKEYVEKHAKKNRQEWKKELIGE